MQGNTKWNGTKIKIGQKVRHLNFRGVGIVVQILANGTRVSVDFPGTNGVIDAVSHFKPVVPKKCGHLISGEYD